MYRRKLNVLLLGICIATWFVALAARAEPPRNKAEELFRQMEQACVQAKSANVAFSGKFQGAIDGELKGSLLLATGNKFRLEMKGDLAIGTDGIQPVNVAMACDGKQSRTASLDPKIPSQVVDVTNNYDTEMRLQLARAGILGPMFMLAENVPPSEKPREFDAEKQLGVSDFQLGENQIIGEQQALTRPPQGFASTRRLRVMPQSATEKMGRETGKRPSTSS